MATCCLCQPMVGTRKMSSLPPAKLFTQQMRQMTPVTVGQELKRDDTCQSLLVPVDKSSSLSLFAHGQDASQDWDLKGLGQ
jgi:hypothetical protein